MVKRWLRLQTCQLVNLSPTKPLINSSTYWLVNLSTCYFVNSLTCHLINLLTSHLVNLLTCQLVNLVTCHLINSLTSHLVNLLTCLLVNSLTRQLNYPSTKPPVNSSTNVNFLVRFLTLWVPFYPPSVHPVAKNRFSRRLVLMQKGVSMWMRQNEFLLKKTAVCTRFWAVCC